MRVPNGRIYELCLLVLTYQLISRVVPVAFMTLVPHTVHVEVDGPVVHLSCVIGVQGMAMVLCVCPHGGMFSFFQLVVPMDVIIGSPICIRIRRTGKIVTDTDGMVRIEGIVYRKLGT